MQINSPLSPTKVDQDCKQAFSFPFDLYVVIKNRGEGMAVTKSCHEKKVSSPGHASVTLKPD